MPHRAGIVGLGHVFGWQRSALEQLDAFELAALCDRDPGTRPDDGSPSFDTELRSFLAREDVDLVVVSVPPVDHFAVAHACLEAGKHVLLEKPATETLRQLETLYETADRHDRRLVVGFHAAFGREVLWWLRQSQAERDARWGPLTGFECDLRDPYMEGQDLAERARSLGGSWMDAGINGLSVVSLVAERLCVRDGSFVRAHASPPVDVRSEVRFDFSGPGESGGIGVVGVNWTLGMDRKHTTLHHASSGLSILLDHSLQRVVERDVTGRQRVLADLSDRFPRLTEHYLGVFEEVAKHLDRGSDNREEAVKLHTLLFDALRVEGAGSKKES